MLLSLRSYGTGNNRKNAVSFSHDFSADSISTFHLGGISVTGASVTVDIASLLAQVQNLPSFKSLQITASFRAVIGADAGAPVFDGPVVIYSPTTGQSVVLSPVSQPSPALGTLTGQVVVMSGIIPIETVAPSLLVIGKGVASDASLYGKIVGTLFDYDLPAYMNQGVTAGGI